MSEIIRVARRAMMTPYPTAGLRQAAELLNGAKNVFVLSGAGLSKASGIPTYRDVDGLWETGDNLKYSSIEAYRQDPTSFLKFWAARRAEIAHAKPNAGHIALRDLQQLKSSTLATQNVDGLLTAAGCTDVLELHGNMTRVQCDRCASRQATALMGRCIHCFARVRPAVVLFGEALPERTLQAARMGASECDVILVVGTSAVVDPAAELPITALKFGAQLIVLDTEPTALARAADVSLLGTAETLLPELIDRLRIIVGSRVLLKDSTVKALGSGR